MGVALSRHALLAGLLAVSLAGGALEVFPNP
jgi:hypothetical protein